MPLPMICASSSPCRRTICATSPSVGKVCVERPAKASARSRNNHGRPRQPRPPRPRPHRSAPSSPARRWPPRCRHCRAPGCPRAPPASRSRPSRPRPSFKEVVNVGTVVDITVSKNVESTKPQQSQYVEFIVPAGSDHQEIKIVVIDDAGSRVVYNNASHKPGVRLRQQIEGTGNIRVQFYSNDKLVEEEACDY